MKRERISEVEVAARVIPWLEDMEWEVFQEVQPMRADYRADIVARRGSLIWVIETKTSMSLALLEQGRQWIGRANLISVCIPRLYRNNGGGVAEEFARHVGLGVLVAHGKCEVDERVMPKLFRRTPAGNWNLHEGHKTCAPAGSKGGYWSPFRQTCKNVRDFVEKKPGATLKETIGSIEHHYMSSETARSSLRQWILNGKVPGVRSEVVGRNTLLYPVESKEVSA